MEEIKFDKGWKIKAIDATVNQLENRCRILTYVDWLATIIGIILLYVAAIAYSIKYFYSGIFLLILGMILIFLGFNCTDARGSLQLLIYLKRQFEK